jgi:hypothetical protein
MMVPLILFKFAAIIKQKKDDLDTQFNLLNVSPIADLQRYFSKMKSEMKNQLIENSEKPPYNPLYLSTTKDGYGESHRFCVAGTV